MKKPGKVQSVRTIAIRITEGDRQLLLALQADEQDRQPRKNVSLGPLIRECAIAEAERRGYRLSKDRKGQIVAEKSAAKPATAT